jgi:hypothetical protein
MGQVIHLNRLSAAFPTAAAVTVLDGAEATLLGALRTWVAAYRSGDDPLSRLCEAMDRAGAYGAAFCVDRLMAVIARSVRQPIAIHCPRCPHLSGDEKRLLQAASLVQIGESGLAERALRAALLSAAGAEFIIGPLEELAELFHEAGLLFRRRPITADHPASADVAWIPPDAAEGPPN